MFLMRRFYYTFVNRLGYFHTFKQVPAWDKVFDQKLWYFMIGVIGLRPHFLKPEKFQNENIYVLNPTRGSGFLRYRVMIKSLVFLLRITRSLVPHTRHLKVPILLINWCPLCLSFARCLFYLYHSSLVIGVLLSIIGLK